MSTTDHDIKPAKSPGGRPPLAAGQQSERITVRLTAAQRETFDRLGGAEWLRAQLDILQKALDA